MRGGSFIAVAAAIAVAACAHKTDDASGAAGAPAEIAPAPSAAPAPPSATAPITPAQPNVTCDPWPAPRGMTSAPTSAPVTCTWSQEDGLEHIGSALIVPAATANVIWASSPGDVYLSVAVPSHAPSGAIAHFDGVSWRLELLPMAVAQVSIWGAVAGSPWAAGISSDTRPVLFHRVDGKWQTAAKAVGRRIVEVSVTGADDDHLLLAGRDDVGPLHVYRYCAGALVEVPFGPQPADRGVGGVLLLEGPRMVVWGSKSNGTMKAASETVELFDGMTLQSTATFAPVRKLTIHDEHIAAPRGLGIAGLSGSSLEDMFVLALEYPGWPQPLQILHTTDGMKTWTSLAVPPARASNMQVAAPLHGAVFGVSCARTALDQPAPADCARLVRLDASSVVDLDPIDPNGGPPQAVWADVANGDLHVVLGAWESPLHHYRAHCE